MKLLTLNTHSLLEQNYAEKSEIFVSVVAAEQPDIIALQEVNQTCCKAQLSAAVLEQYCACDPNAVIREDNHVFHVVNRLRHKGIPYYWTWLPLKNGYDKYEEGLALMSLHPIAETAIVTVSAVDDYYNWKTRKLLGIRTETLPDEWFFSVHYGWWGDPAEPFSRQWERTGLHMDPYEKVWLMGDFNNPAEIRQEGYDTMAGNGWYDSYVLAAQKDDGITVKTVIDGWKEIIDSTTGMRIDQIWCKQKAAVKKSTVIFNGTHYPVVSDHYGVMIEL